MTIISVQRPNVKIVIDYRPRNVLSAAERKNARVLKRTGGFALKVSRQIVGKKRPRKLTKTGRISKAWSRSQATKGNRPPFRGNQTARFQKRSAFELIGTNILRVGPYKLGSTTRPSGPPTVPALLSDGGGAIIIVGAKRKKERAQFAPHSYKHKVLEKSLPKLRENIRTIPLK